MGLKSPNNADAVVWGITELAGGNPWGILDALREQAESIRAAQPTEMSTDPKELGDAQKRDSIGWMGALKPGGLGKVVKATQMPACTNCGNLGLTVFSETWKCGACGETGTL
jgi:ribosomal protein S27AE